MKRIPYKYGRCAHPYERKRVNQNSPHATPASVATDIHYAILMLEERWNWERFARICQFLKMTPHELGSLVRLSHSAVEAFRKNNRLTPPIDGPVSLLLTLVEGHFCKAYSADVIENPFPKSADPNS